MTDFATRLEMLTPTLFLDALPLTDLQLERLEAETAAEAKAAVRRRKSDCDGTLRRMRQLVEDNRLL